MSAQISDHREKKMTMLRQHRMAKGLTLRQVGQRTGVTVAAVSKWEIGCSIPSAGVIPKLARVLGIAPLELMQLLSQDRKGAA